jgi:hypothetical protein
MFRRNRHPTGLAQEASSWARTASQNWSLSSRPRAVNGENEHAEVAQADGSVVPPLLLEW